MGVYFNIFEECGCILLIEKFWFLKVMIYNNELCIYLLKWLWYLYLLCCFIFIEFYFYMYILCDVGFDSNDDDIGINIFFLLVFKYILVFVLYLCFYLFGLLKE